MFPFLMSVTLAVSGPVHACRLNVKTNLQDAFEADAVIVGHVVDYDVVKHGQFKGVTRHARFKVRVDTTISGDVTDRLDPDGLLSFAWGNSVFGVPDSMNLKERYFFALRDLPLQSSFHFFGPTETAPRIDPIQYTVLQAPCSQPFLFLDASPQSQMLQQAFQSEWDPVLVLEILEEFVFERKAVRALQRDKYRLERGLRRIESSSETGD